MTVERRDVTFRTGDGVAADSLFQPEHIAPGARPPAVALAPGTGGVKELYQVAIRENSRPGLAPPLAEPRACRRLCLHGEHHCPGQLDRSAHFSTDR